jgi:hypothetical protein
LSGTRRLPHLCLPEEFEVDRACKTSIWEDPRTTEGQLLWPAKIRPPEIAALQSKLGSYAYAGQYQQRPSPSGGGIFKRWWFRYWKPKLMNLQPVLVKLADGTMLEIKPVPAGRIRLSPAELGHDVQGPKGFRLRRRRRVGIEGMRHRQTSFRWSACPTEPPLRRRSLAILTLHIAHTVDNMQG